MMNVPDLAQFYAQVDIVLLQSTETQTIVLVYIKNFNTHADTKWNQCVLRISLISGFFLVVITPEVVWNRRITYRVPANTTGQDVHTLHKAVKYIHLTALIINSVNPFNSFSL